MSVGRLSLRLTPILVLACLSLIFLFTVPGQASLSVAFDYGGDIYIADFLGDLVNITHSDTYEMRPVWSPDGTQIAFLTSGSYRTSNESHLTVMTLATGEVRPLSELEFSSETTLTWSPDGRSIAATLGTIFIVNVETGEDRRLLVG